jgi:hypothetical protein
VTARGCEMEGRPGVPRGSGERSSVAGVLHVDLARRWWNLKGARGSPTLRKILLDFSLAFRRAHLLRLLGRLQSPRDGHHRTTVTEHSILKVRP